MFGNINIIIGGFTDAFYPGPVMLSVFLKTFTREMDYPITCKSPNGPLDEPLYTVGLSQGTVLMNYLGMAIVSYRSVTSIESSLFGSEHRGYQIVFRYTVWNGPLAHQTPLYSVPRLFDYTDAHRVIFIFVI